jgi:hypothetical protein
MCENCALDIHLKSSWKFSLKYIDLDSDLAVPFILFNPAQDPVRYRLESPDQGYVVQSHPRHLDLEISELEDS